MNITTVGIDLAKSVFQVHGVDARVIRDRRLGVNCRSSCELGKW
jgi:hypothetical protein